MVLKRAILKNQCGDAFLAFPKYTTRIATPTTACSQWIKHKLQEKWVRLCCIRGRDSMHNVRCTDEGFQEVLGRGHRQKRTEKMVSSVMAAFEDDDGQHQAVPLRKHTRKRPRPLKPSKKSATGTRFDPLPIEVASDADDCDFEGSSSSSDDSSSKSGSDQELSNTEVI
jgi:hypothetical protein